MAEVIPQYEVLYDDLKNHSIGTFLVSRDFKIFMSEKAYYQQWKEIFENVYSQRNYMVLGSTHEYTDSLNTLKIYLNSIPNKLNIENTVTCIIAKFIDFKKVKTDFSDILQSMKISKFSEHNIQTIESSIENHIKKVFWDEEDKLITKRAISTNSSMNHKDIFIVHGHNNEIKYNVARVVEKLKLNPIILNEQSNSGMTIIEKFEKYSNVSYAIILLTGDDFGNAKNVQQLNKRARQNVILELGYFIAKLGRKKIFTLYEDGVELPSDVLGVLYTKIDDADKWQFQLVKELKTAGFNVNADDIL